MMNKYTNKIIKSMQTGNFVETIAHAINKRIPVQYIYNKGILDLQMQDRAKRKLSKMYAKLIQNSAYKTDDMSSFNNRTIWWCWLQGIDNAPNMVRKCYESLEREMRDYKITVISKENLGEYVNLPDYVLEKYRKGWISNANFSDMIRMDLLSRYGGIWIDATVYCTGNWLTPVIEDSPMFFFQETNSVTKILAGSSWFIASKANNPVISLTRDLMFEYWKEHKVAMHYYLVHVFLSLALERFNDIYESIPRYSNAAPHILYGELNEEYSDDRFDEIKRMSPFHKLNYKLQYEKGNNFYEVLFGGIDENNT